MSDPLARYYEMVIREEIERQIAKDGPDGRIGLTAAGLDVEAIARLVADERAPSPDHPLTGLLEPGARRYDEKVSSAISLKRIADALDKIGLGNPDAADIIHGFVTNLAFDAGRSFDRGTRQHR